MKKNPLIIIGALILIIIVLPFLISKNSQSICVGAGCIPGGTTTTTTYAVVSEPVDARGFPIYSHCIDSDGLNPNTRSTLRYWNGASEEDCTDTCADTHTVSECYCTYYAVATYGTPGWDKMNRACEEGKKCQNGYCINDPNYYTCTDSDGANYQTKGTVTTQSQSQSDYCEALNLLIEFTCNGNQLAANEIVCSCSNGVCSGSTATTHPVGNQCSDNDGTDYYNKGTVTFGTSTYTDSCSGNTLTEYYCTSQNSYSTINENCVLGCNTGACNHVTSTSQPINTCSIKGDVMTCNSICDDEYSVIVANWKGQQVSESQYATAVNYWKNSNNRC